MATAPGEALLRDGKRLFLMVRRADLRVVPRLRYLSLGLPFVHDVGEFPHGLGLDDQRVVDGRRAQLDAAGQVGGEVGSRVACCQPTRWRHDVIMATSAPTLARCSAEPACPWRWRTGPPRRCPMCQADDHAPTVSRASGFAISYATPGDEDDGDGAHKVGPVGEIRSSAADLSLSQVGPGALKTPCQATKTTATVRTRSVQ
jgi:hypothetical protein